MSSVIDSFLDTVRQFSDVGLRFLAYQPIRIPKVSAAQLQEEIEERWADLEREVGSIVRERNAGDSEDDGNTAVTEPAAVAGAPAVQGGWGPMP